MFADILSAVSWADVGLAIVAIAALKAAPLVVKTGSRLVLSMIR